MRVIGLLVFVLACTLCASSKIPKKHLAGPASEFSLHALPAPLAGAVLEDSAFYTSKLVQNPRNLRQVLWQQDLVVDSKDAFAFSVYSPHQDYLIVKLVDPSGHEVDLSDRAYPGIFPVGMKSVPETTYYFTDAPIGTYKLTISSKDLEENLLSNITKSETPNVAALLWNKSEVKMYTHLNTYNLYVGSNVGLVTSTTESDVVSPLVRASPSNHGSITAAKLDIILPDGKSVDVPMHDDGLHADLGASDGVWGGSIQATEAGIYKAQAEIKGKMTDGTEFVRTTSHLISVVNDEISLTGVAYGQITQADHERMQIAVGVQTTSGSDTENRYRAYAEVWGRDASGKNEVPVCWVGGMVDVEGSTFKSVNLELNLKWVAMAAAHEPFVLKNVYIQDVIAEIPVAQSKEISVKTNTNVKAHIEAYQIRSVEITKEMRQGKRPESLMAKQDGKSGIVLLHGYCSETNPWEPDQHIFPDGHYFLNPSASIGNEEFANMVVKFAESKGLSSYSLIGHSQGGMVSAHILNYYFTGLDNAVTPGKRLVQSVGTPYMGCSAAGNMASVGSVFGVGCGSNFDLSADGAKLWLSGISNDTRAEVYYYTTTYKRGGFFGDYCSLAMNLILQWPNDGTSELIYTQLEGAHNMGNTEGWCHTTDMKYTAQYDDEVRNKQMAELAAR